MMKSWALDSILEQGADRFDRSGDGARKKGIERAAQTTRKRMEEAFSPARKVAAKLRQIEAC